MRHGSQGRRRNNNNRGHHNNQNNGQRRPAHNRNQIFDSNGPDVRIRGTAFQVCEKYMALAKDASAVGDTILAESYLQHAEHYQRIINSFAEEYRDTYRPAAPSFPTGDGMVDNAVTPVAAQVGRDDDLALPASILGGEVKVESQTMTRSSAYGSSTALESVE
jgi:hypothetical protein